MIEMESFPYSNIAQKELPFSVRLFPRKNRLFQMPFSLTGVGKDHQWRSLLNTGQHELGEKERPGTWIRT